MEVIGDSQIPSALLLLFGFSFIAPAGADIFIEVVGIDHADKSVKMTETPIVGAEE